MNKIILQSILIVALILLFSGCVDNSGSDANTSQQGTGMVAVTDIEDIDRALESGPVLVEVGSETCSACAAQKGIMDEIAAEYEGQASVMYVDTRDATPVALIFGGIEYVPDSFVIVDREGDQYVYMGADGQTTTDRNSARFVGLTNKESLVQALGPAVEMRQGENSSVEAEAAPVEIQESVEMTEITTFEEINQSLASGPVMVEVGSESCSACAAQKPIMNEIATEYQQDASVLYIDNRRGNELAAWFGAGYVPDSFVIVDIEDGQYVYMKPDGQTTTDRSTARFLGPAEKASLVQTLEEAIEVRQ